MDWAQQSLKRWTRTGTRDGHLLNSTYPTLSKGEGAELDFILLRAQFTNTAVIGPQSISISVAGCVDIKGGWIKFRWPVPFTSKS